MDMMSKDDVGHKLGRCAREPVYQQHKDKFSRTWPAAQLEGQKTDEPGDLQQSNKLLKDFNNKAKHNGQEVTKWMLENAWKKVYPTKNGANAAETESGRKSPTQTGTKTSAPYTPSSSQGSTPNRQVAAPQSALAHRPSPFNKPALASGGSSKHGGLSKQTAVSNLPSVSGQKRFQISEPPPPAAHPIKFPEYRFAVHNNCPLDAEIKPVVAPADRLGAGGRPLTIAANYVAINGYPAKLHMYSIDYGNITPIKTKKQLDEDQAKVAEAKMSTVAAVVGNEGEGTSKKPTGRKIG